MSPAQRKTSHRATWLFGRRKQIRFRAAYVQFLLARLNLH